MLFQVYLGKESPKFFPAGPFFSVFQIKYLSKCPPLPWKIPGYTPDKFISFLINVFSFSLFTFFLINWIIKQKQACVGNVLIKIESFLWSSSVKDFNQAGISIFFISNLKF